jgi:6-phosphogluconolactonase
MTEAAAIVGPTETLRWVAHSSSGLGREVAVQVFDTAAEANAYTVSRIASALQGAVAQRGQAAWLGCGGGTPKPVYEALVNVDVNWDRVTLVQVDERFVPLDDPSSNTRMMRAACAPVMGQGMSFLSLYQDDDIYASAARAETQLLELGGGQPPAFDIALMGMGADAHYASIFPGHAINGTIYQTSAVVVPVTASGTDKEPVLARLTLSVPAINAAKTVLFLITGRPKLEVLKTASLSDDAYAAPIGAFLAQCPSPVEFIWAP